MRKLRLLWLVILLTLVAGALPALLPQPAAAADEVRYNRFDVDIAIDASGNFRVTEKQTITFPSRHIHARLAEYRPRQRDRCARCGRHFRVADLHPDDEYDEPHARIPSASTAPIAT